MGADAGAGSGMQFDKVETGAVAPPACAKCGRRLDEYFELAGRMFCRPCVDGMPRGSFWRALLFGGAAATLGSLIWYGVTAASHGSYGLIGIVVGLIVGIAVKRGASGRGGWPYQTLAMVLTYLAITTSYVPEILEGHAHAKSEPAGESGVGELATGGAPAEAAAAPRDTGPGAAMVVLAFVIAAVGPFLGGVGMMGWIIIGIALYEAWKINRRVPLSGPFRFSGALSVPAPAPVTPGMPPPAAAP